MPVPKYDWRKNIDRQIRIRQATRDAWVAGYNERRPVGVPNEWLKGFPPTIGLSYIAGREAYSAEATGSFYVEDDREWYNRFPDRL